jgi:hypothetical protein
MLQLIFTVCSILNGAACHAMAPIPLAEGTGMMGCLIASQQEGAKYVSEHPNSYIIKATCAPTGLMANL